MKLWALVLTRSTRKREHRLRLAPPMKRAGIQDREQPEENEGEIRRARQLLQKGATREKEYQASRGAEDEDPLMSNERRNRSDRHFVKLTGPVPRARRSRRWYSREPQKSGKK